MMKIKFFLQQNIKLSCCYLSSQMSNYYYVERLMKELMMMLQHFILYCCFIAYFIQEISLLMILRMILLLLLLLLLILLRLPATAEICYSSIIITYRVKQRFMGMELLMLLTMEEVKNFLNNQLLSMTLDICFLLFNSFKIKKF